MMTQSSTPHDSECLQLAEQTLFQMCPTAMFILDSCGRVIRWNPAAERLFLWTEHEVRGLVPWSTEEADSPRFKSYRAKIEQGEEIASHSVRLRDREGKRMDVQLCGQAVSDSAGVLIATSWTAEPAARQSPVNEDVRTITRGVNCILWDEILERRDGRYTWDFRIVDEEAAARLLPLDVPPGKSYTQTWLESRLYEDRDATDENWNRALRSGAPGYSQEFRCVQKDGSIRWFSEVVRIEPIGEERWRLFGVCLDITDARITLEDLQYVVSRAGCILWHASVTPDENAAGRFVWKTQVFDEEAAQRFLPLIREPGQSYTIAWYHSRTDEENARLDECSSRALREGWPGYSQEIQCRRSDGETRCLLEQARIEQIAPGSWRLAGICTDITEIKRAEEQIQTLNEALERRVQERTSLLEAANHELESFAYAVAHDLRGPLRSIDGYCYAILDDYGDRIDDAGKSYLERARAASQHMGQVMDALLSLSRLTRGSTEFESVDLSQMAESILKDLRSASPERRAQIEIEPALRACGSPHLLRIALQNLLGNSWKFTAGQNPARIEVGVTGADGDSVFYVRDNGVGFDMQYADKLFGAFQRLHTEAEFTGTGIGLATVQRVIRRHGGRVWAEASPGQGATFFFTL